MDRTSKYQEQGRNPWRRLRTISAVSATALSATLLSACNTSPECGAVLEDDRLTTRVFGLPDYDVYAKANQTDFYVDEKQFTYEEQPAEIEVRGVVLHVDYSESTSDSAGIPYIIKLTCVE